jgi:anti-sigma regulatory factor (Ser/Thr protein kinase)/CheY-like chemotaxis protein
LETLPEPPPPPAPVAAPRSRTGRILIVGGNDELRRGLVTARDLAEVDIDLCDGNAAALRCVRRRACDVLITDAAATAAENLALLKEVRHLRPGVRALLLALSQTPDEVLEALRQQVFATFSAPFDVEEIALMARRAIDEVDWHDGIEVVSGMRDWVTLRVSCRLVSAERLTRFMTEHRSDLGPDERDLLMVAFREMLINAMEHGAGFDPEKVVEVTAARTDRTVVFHFRDPGPGFRRHGLTHAAADLDDPLSHLDVREEEGLRPGGFGMLLVKQIVDEVIYNEQGNEVILIKHLK